MTDIKGRITIHNKKNEHDALFEKLGISMNTAAKCLDS